MDGRRWCLRAKISVEDANKALYTIEQGKVLVAYPRTQEKLECLSHMILHAL